VKEKRIRIRTKKLNLIMDVFISLISLIPVQITNIFGKKYRKGKATFGGGRE
jgi:hypothetical protein